MTLAELKTRTLLELLAAFTEVMDEVEGQVALNGESVLHPSTYTRADLALEAARFELAQGND